MELPQIMAILATAGGPSTFVLARNSPERELVLSSSVVIQGVLLSAFLTESRVDLELVPGSSVIKRVNPFAAGKGHFHSWPGEYRISRLATQRSPEGEDHLEVFLVKGAEPEKAYNVYDPLLQQLLQAVFGTTNADPVRQGLHIEFDGNNISTVRLGER